MKELLPFSIVFCLAFVSCGACNQPGASGDEYRYGSRRPSDSTGTGRMYFGREIASVTANAGGAEWREQRDRDNAELPERIVSNLDLKSGDVIADIGAGTGYLTFRLAEQVPYGRVFAVDIQRDMLEVVNARIDSLGISNVDTVLGTARSPNLPPGSTDAVLMVAAYHEFYYPWEMMNSIFEALKPGGRVVVIEYRGEDDTIDLSPLHKLTELQIRKEMEAIGLEHRLTRDILPQQHLIVFHKPFDV